MEATRPVSALWERPLPTPKCSTEGPTFTVDSWSPWNEGKFLVEIEDDKLSCSYFWVYSQIPQKQKTRNQINKSSLETFIGKEEEEELYLTNHIQTRLSQNALLNLPKEIWLKRRELKSIFRFYFQTPRKIKTLKANSKNICFHCPDSWDGK